MNVAEFAAWLLETQDHGATVEVVDHTSSVGSNYYMQGGDAVAVPFDPENTDLFDATDWRDNQFVEPDAPHFGTRTLLLGRHDG